MRRLLIVAVILGLAACAIGDQPTTQPSGKAVRNVPQYLQDISVTIHAGTGLNMAQGSGVIKTRDGVNYVWTAAHVLSGLRTTRTVIDPKTGATKTAVEFSDAKVVKELTENGRAVGRLEMDAEVLRYSDPDNGEDLALMRIRKRNFVSASVEFWTKAEIPPVMTRLVHCGSLLGQMGSNSITTGIMSQIGRVRNNFVFDQTTCTAFPGSSGGGVYTEDGKYVGMITRGAGEGFNLIVPIRRIRSWAKKVKVEFAIDDSVSVPAEDVLKAQPVDDAGSAFASPTTQPARSVKVELNTMEKK